LQYHFPDDAQQIRQLMLPPEPTVEFPHPASLSEQAAAFAVLGCDLDSLGAAVARHWSLGDELLHMIRRQSPDAPVRHSEGDADLLRLTCSFANELEDALNLPESKRQAGIEIATRRYARPLGLGLRDVYNALNPEAPKAAEDFPQDRAEAALGKPQESVDPLQPGAIAAPKASALRSRLAAMTPPNRDGSGGNGSSGNTGNSGSGGSR